jgi:hypothetical protein
LRAGRGSGFGFCPGTRVRGRRRRGGAQALCRK